MKTVYQQLYHLKLSGVRDALKQQTEQPNAYVELSFEERLALLLDNEITQRDNRRVERLTRQAKFRVSAQLAQLDYQSGRQINKAQIRSLAQGVWLRLHQNILITGATGCGKTYMIVYTLRNLKNFEQIIKPVRLRKFPYVFLGWEMTLAKEIRDDFIRLDSAYGRAVQGGALISY